ncbi:MAG TPA: hypothetical protein DD671_08755 [Balneolaceae bacterium]|nr:hypothetical protein [Balneolaceae bacterium]
MNKKTKNDTDKGIESENDEAIDPIHTEDYKDGDRKQIKHPGPTVAQKKEQHDRNKIQGPVK